MMNNKAEKLRDLLAHAANAIDEKYGIENINEEVSMETDLFGKRSFILCTPIGFQELCVTVWWGYKLSKAIDCHNIWFSGAKNKTIDAMVGGWIERKDGLWIQGVGSIGLTICIVLVMLSRIWTIFQLLSLQRLDVQASTIYESLRHKDTDFFRRARDSGTEEDHLLTGKREGMYNESTISSPNDFYI